MSNTATLPRNRTRPTGALRRRQARINGAEATHAREHTRGWRRQHDRCRRRSVCDCAGWWPRRAAVSGADREHATFSPLVNLVKTHPRPHLHHQRSRKAARARALELGEACCERAANRSSRVRQRSRRGPQCLRVQPPAPSLPPGCTRNLVRPFWGVGGFQMTQSMKSNVWASGRALGTVRFSSVNKVKRGRRVRKNHVYGT